MGSVTPRYYTVEALQLQVYTFDSPALNALEHRSIKYHMAKLFDKLDKHASKSQDVLDAEDLAAEMNDNVFLAEVVLGQGNDFFAEFDAKAKAEAEQQVKVDADIHLALVEAEDALEIITWIKVEGRWRRCPVDAKTEPVVDKKWVRVGKGRWEYMN